MKKLLLKILVFMFSINSIACPTCEKAQPKIFRGITHGTGPDSNWDYLIIGLTAVIVLYSAVLSIYKLIRPNEKNEQHVKNAFLN